MRGNEKHKRKEKHKRNFENEKHIVEVGDAGDRTPCLSHAKLHTCFFVIFYNSFLNCTRCLEVWTG
jgi:hypothetical protein